MTVLIIIHSYDFNKIFFKLINYKNYIQILSSDFNFNFLYFSYHGFVNPKMLF